MGNTLHFMAEGYWPAEENYRSEELLVEDQEMLEILMNAGILIQFSVSMDHTRWWAIFNAPSEMDVRLLIEDLLPGSHPNIHLLSDIQIPAPEVCLFSDN